MKGPSLAFNVMKGSFMTLNERIGPLILGGGGQGWPGRGGVAGVWPPAWRHDIARTAASVRASRAVLRTPESDVCSSTDRQVDAASASADTSSVNAEDWLVSGCGVR